MERREFNERTGGNGVRDEARPAVVGRTADVEPLAAAVGARDAEGFASDRCVARHGHNRKQVAVDRAGG